MRILIFTGFLFWIALSAQGLHAQSLDLAEHGDQRVVLGALPCAGAGQARQRGWRHLAWEIQKRTSLETELELLAVDPAGPGLFATPLLLWSCEGPVAELAPAARQNLRRFLSLGGLLWIDDPQAAPEGTFMTSVKAELGKLWSDKSLAVLPSDHVLFKAFFLIRKQGGRRRVGRLQGLSLGDRLAVIHTPNDILGALSRDLLGNEELVVEGGSLMREYALRMGVNLVMYALCLDYKDDRVHLPFILKRRRI